MEGATLTVKHDGATGGPQKVRCEPATELQLRLPSRSLHGLISSKRLFRVFVDFLHYAVPSSNREENSSSSSAPEGGEVHCRERAIFQLAARVFGKTEYQTR